MPRRSKSSPQKRAPPRRTAEKSAKLPRPHTNAAFTIWTLSAGFILRVNLHDSRARSRRTGRAGWRLRPAEAKGHAGDDRDELVLPAAAPGNWPIGNGYRHFGVVDGRSSGGVGAGLASVRACCAT